MLLSYLDSNQDKLIQSQMCYRYTIGHSHFSRRLGVSIGLKSGAKVRFFFQLANFFFFWFDFNYVLFKLSAFSVSNIFTLRLKLKCIFRVIIGRWKWIFIHYVSLIEEES